MPAPFIAGGAQSAAATAFGANMTLMAAEAAVPPPKLPGAVQIAFGNVLVDGFSPRTSSAADPVVAGVIGQFHVNTASGSAFIYNGAAWKKLKYDP